MIDTQILLYKNVEIGCAELPVPETTINNTFIDKPIVNRANTIPGMNRQTETIQKDSLKQTTARSYEMDNGVICENIAIIDDSDNPGDILSCTDMSPENELIVIISDDIKHDELTSLYNKFKNRLKIIIHYGNNGNIKQVFEHFSQIISAKSLQKAVN
ncbi:MAG: hypothetical protein B6I20_05670 [Bacteroidetes bacterium 4572_117]|nr:MAG: hypothetical protein B6I20_05670 [Bacteroidetes bacterium 4572_117]